MKTTIVCRLQLEGLHKWSKCPFEQVKFLRDLLGQLPEEEQAKYKEVVLSDSITWQYAKENIPVMQELANKAKNKSSNAPF